MSHQFFAGLQRVIVLNSIAGAWAESWDRAGNYVELLNDSLKYGGEGGIRTHVPVTRQDAFEAPPLRPLRYLSVACAGVPAVMT
jgi:hypothetical protein